MIWFNFSLLITYKSGKNVFTNRCFYGNLYPWATLGRSFWNLNLLFSTVLHGIKLTASMYAIHLSKISAWGFGTLIIPTLSYAFCCQGFTASIMYIIFSLGYCFKCYRRLVVLPIFARTVLQLPTLHCILLPRNIVNTLKDLRLNILLQ